VIARRVLALLLAACPLWGQPPRRAVLIDVDGVRRDTFEQAWHDGMLPQLVRIFAGAVWFDRAQTVVPSVTMAAQASIATGAPPARHGIPGNQWWDREQGRLYDYMNAAGISCVYGFSLLAGPACLTGLGNRHLEVPTLYQAAAAQGLDSVVAYNQYWKGASRPAAPTFAEARAFLPGNRPDFRTFDTQMTGRVLAELHDHGLPAILVVYFAGADALAHSNGIAAQPAYFAEVIDPLVGRILGEMAALDPEWRAHTLFVLTSDHGRTDAVAYPEDPALQRDLEGALPAGAHVAQNGGVAFIYLDRPDPGLPAALERKFPTAIAAVRQRNSGDAPRAGDLIVTLRPGHYFGNIGKGSDHGSASPDDLNVPLVLAAPGFPLSHIADPVSITQIARTIADFVGFPMETADPALPILHEMRRR
jgi:hypothetical protein